MTTVLVDRLVKAEVTNGGVLNNLASDSVVSLMHTEFWYKWDMRIDAQKLEASLKQVLSLYPAVSGRIAHGNRATTTNDGDQIIQVICNNKGVSYRVVEKYGSVEQQGNQKADAYDLQKTIHGEHPLLFVELTLFKNGGSMLALVMNHFVFDGCTMGMFISDWSAVHNGHDIKPVSLNLSRNLATCHNGIPKFSPWICSGHGLVHRCCLWHFTKTLAKGTQPTDKRTILHFSASELRGLKQRAQTSAGTWVSTSEALLAHLLPLVIDSFSVSHIADITVAIPVNVRSKVSGCDSREIGNRVFWRTIKPFPCKGSVALAIHESVRAAVAEPSLTGPDPGSFLTGARLLICWNDQSAMAYNDVDFGAGKPKHVDMRAYPGTLTVVPSLQGGVDVIMVNHPGSGLHTWVQRPHKVLRRFLQVAPLLVLCQSWRNGESTLRGGKTGLCAILGIVLAAGRMLNKVHERCVENCFARLENHPDLRVEKLPAPGN